MSATVDAAPDTVADSAAPARILLSLPGIHCAGCIASIERDLVHHPGVESARVNLTLKRASVDASPDVSAAALIERLDRLGFEAHELDPGTLTRDASAKQERDLLIRLGVAGFAMMNIMLLSVGVWSGAEGATRDMFHMISGAIALPTVVFAGQPFFRSAWASLQGRRLGMDVPISLAIVLASGISVYETFHSGPHAYFDAAVMLVFFLLAGRYLDFRTRAAARSAAQELAALEVPRANRLDPDGEHEVPVSALEVDDLVQVRPGGRIPVDGVVTGGTSELDRSLLTGESLPAHAGPGTALSAGEVNLTGPLTLRVTAAGEDSSLHRMADLVATAESARGRYTSLADRAARAYSPVVHLLALISFVGWMWVSGGDVRLSVNIAAAVLIITCPCALGLAVPAVATAASGKLFRGGMLIKNGTALERMAEIDTVVFDKTGTLTLGTPEPTNLDRLDADTSSVAAALAQASSHPLARALAARLSVPAVALDDVAEVPGYGVEATWNGERVQLGRARWVGAEPEALTAAYLRIGAAAPVALTFTDRLRPGAEAAIAALRQQGLSVRLISGDAPGAVAALADRLGIDDWRAETLPEDKAALVAELSAQGRKVLMVGDGLNDTAALAAAHASVSPASALDAARVASDVVLLGQDMTPLGQALRTARVATRRIRENFVISTVYNVVAVPIALFGFATPLWAALAMSLSSITVALNALRLK